MCYRFKFVPPVAAEKLFLLWELKLYVSAFNLCTFLIQVKTHFVTDIKAVYLNFPDLSGGDLNVGG